MYIESESQLGGHNNTENNSFLNDLLQQISKKTFSLHVKKACEIKFRMPEYIND